MTLPRRFTPYAALYDCPQNAVASHPELRHASITYELSSLIPANGSLTSSRFSFFTRPQAMDTQSAVPSWELTLRVLPHAFPNSATERGKRSSPDPLLRNVNTWRCRPGVDSNAAERFPHSKSRTTSRIRTRTRLAFIIGNTPRPSTRTDLLSSPTSYQSSFSEIHPFVIALPVFCGPERRASSPLIEKVSGDEEILLECTSATKEPV